MSKFYISGRVINVQTQRGVSGVYVEAWDKDLIFDDLVGSAITDSQGRFKIEFTEAHFRECFLDRKPDLFFKVFSAEKKLLASTEDSILWNVDTEDTEVEIAVDLQSSSYIVNGRVVDSDGRPVASVLVHAAWPRLRKDQIIGKGTAGVDGHFEFALDLPEEFPIDARIQLVASRDTEKQNKNDSEVRSESMRIIEAKNVLLRFSPLQKDEYSRLIDQLGAQLGGIKIAELREDDAHSDVSFLARELGVPTEHVMRIIIADRVSARINIPAEVIYGFLRLGVPSSLPSSLLEASDGFKMIAPLIEHIVLLIIRVEQEIQKQTIEKAINNRIVPASTTDIVSSIIDKFEQLRVKNQLEAPLGTGKTPLGALLNNAGIDQEKHVKFASTWHKHRGSATRFWEELKKPESGFEAHEVELIRHTFEVGALVKNHIPMIEAVKDTLKKGNETELSTLARMELNDWLAVVENTGDDAVPPNIQPSNEESPAQLYAREIFERVQRRYPTTALAVIVERKQIAPEQLHEPLVQFFLNSPGLDLVQANFGTWLEENRDQAFRNIDQAVQVPTIKQVERLQRVLRIARDPATSATLIVAELDSAAKMNALGRSQTIDLLRQRGISPLESDRIYSIASMRYAASMTLLLQFNAQLRGIYPSATGPAAPFGDVIDSAIKRHPSLANLFGSQDACEVDPCTSILSPSAYLSDILLWLRNRRLRSGGPFTNPLQALRERRPDIGDLNLDCDNTNTPLPYIDLVNELLEDAVSPPDTPIQRQTTRSAAELRAAPEYVNDNAYDVLATATFPHYLPYERAFDELKLVLGNSEIALWQLREAVIPVDAATSSAQATAIAAAYFDIGSAEQVLITTPASTSGATPLSEVWNTANPVVDLEVVADFLQSAQIDYDQLLQLLDAIWLRAGGDAMTLAGVDDTCDISVQTLEGLSEERLDRIHRFLRLWRRSGWQMWEVDELLIAPAVANGLLDETALRAFFVTKRLQDKTGLAVEQLLAFWQDIGTREHRLPNNETQRSLYARIFENPLLPPDPALELATLLSASPPPALSAHLPAVRAALSISPEQADDLAAATSGELTLATLSQMYRIITLVRALRIDIDDAVYLAGNVIANAFASPSETANFIKRSSDVADAGMRIAALRYVLTNTLTPPARSQEQLTETISSVRTALQQIEDDILNSSETSIVILQRQLAALPSLRDAQTLATAISIVDGSFAGSTSDRNAFIATHFGLFMDVSSAQTSLTLPLTTPASPPGPREAEIAARANALLTPLTSWLTQSRVISAIATAFSFTEPHADYLLRNVDQPSTSDRLMDTFTDPALIERDSVSGAYLLEITPADMPQAFAAARLLDKLSLVIRSLRLSADEMAWLVRNGSTVGGLELAQLPVLATQADQSIEAWLVTAQFIVLDRAFDALVFDTSSAVTITSLRALIDGIEDASISSETQIYDALAGITGWSTADINVTATALSIVTPPGPSPVTPNPWLNPNSYERLRRLLAMVAASGANANQIVAWGAAAEPTLSQANEAWNALKSRYTAEAWLDIAPDIMDPLRQRRRDALTWHLLSLRDSAGDPLWGVDTADLFGRFLLDTEMSSCQVTTRIIQAYAAVQLFVQRIIMNLERDAQADVEIDEDWNQWHWMDRYRVWEAARKVFLYPENWLIEAQRPERSEVFVNFDQLTQQREATSDSLEMAALSYMDQLAEVAQLSVTGMCSEPGSGNLYVVGRSAGDPVQFFIRRFADRRWSPWAKIQIEITGQHVIPAFYAGRLHLFWLQVIVTPEPQQRLTGTEGAARDSDTADRYVELRIYSSSLRDDQWQVPQLATQSFFDKPLFSEGQTVTDHDIEVLYTLKVQPGGTYLLIDLYRTGPSSTEEVVAAVLIEAFGMGDLENLFVNAFHIGRAVFDGRFTELQLRNILVDVDTGTGSRQLLERARALYGARAQDLLELVEADAEPALPHEPDMRNEAGALVARQRQPSDPTEIALRFDATVETGTLLRTAPLPYRVIGLANDIPFTPESSFVFNEARRSWFVEPTRYWRNGSVWTTVPPSVPGTLPTQLRFTFHRFYHPFVRSFRHTLSSGGFNAFYQPSVQTAPGDLIPDPTPFSFSATYDPVTPTVRWGSDTDIVDFAYDAPYAGYNWEMFLHMPLFVANRLAQNQRFDEARVWFHYIFDPTRAGATPSPQRYWITRPFTELTNEAVQAQRINNLLAAVNRRDPTALGQVTRWRDDPFNPYLLADLRPVSHMKHVVMSYLDNLIAWGDALFATASREALNEATLLYVMASELLGPRPQLVPPPQRATSSWNELEPQLDAFANAVVAIENYVPPGTGGGSGGGPGGDSEPPLPPGQTFFFKIPPNDKLLAYWDTVDDRLFKLRHCRGLGGEALLLPLFDAPIDPALLVRARAGGLDLGSVLLDLGSPMPNYRFDELHRRATSYTNSVIGLGNALLSALKSKDAESLAAMLMGQRQRVNADSEQILQWQLDEANAHRRAIEHAIELEDYRIESADEAEFMSALEITYTTMKSFTVAQKLVGMVSYLIAGGLAAIPDFLVGAAGVGGSPQAAAKTGGKSASSVAEKGAKAAEKFNEFIEKGADLVKIFAEAEKKYKAKKKDGTIAEFNRQKAEENLEAAEIRVQIAQYQLDQFGQADDDLEAQRQFLQSKFSNEALYDWMVNQLSTIYFRAFRLAMAMARRAERCYRFELGLLDSDVIGPSSWDSLRKGLLAGENLAHDLRRLESSYLDLNVRRKEITRTVSLRNEFPDRLLVLLLTGTCEVDLDELLFDRDYPGHYQRRIVRASISVERPNADTHDNIVCVATLINNSVRLVSTISAGYPRLTPGTDDSRFADQFAAVQGIVTGNAIDDPGLFVRNISSNLNDPRYLPFENAGAISRWRLELPASRNSLDLSTVTDVKLHLHYSALDGGAPLASVAQEAVDAAAPSSLTVAFDVANEFPEAWSAFFSADGEQQLTLPLRPGLLPAVTRGRTIVVTGCDVHLFNDAGRRYDVVLSEPFPTTIFAADPASSGSIIASASIAVPSLALQPLTLRVRERGVTDFASLSTDQLSGMIVALHLGLS